MDRTLSLSWTVHFHVDPNFYIHKTKQKFGLDYLAKVNFPEKACISMIKRRKQLNIPSIAEIDDSNIHSYNFPENWFGDEVTLDSTLADLTYNRTLFFYNCSCLDQFQDCEKIVVDATFPRSKIWKQIFLIHTIKGGKSSIPVMVWMASKQ